MFAAAGRPRSSALALALALAASAAQAQGRTDSERVDEIEFAAPRSCPGQDFFEARLRARVSGELPEALAGRRLRVTIETKANAVHGRIEIVDARADAAHAPAASRQIEAASCREVLEGLALIAALSIAPSKVRDVTTTAEPGQSTAPATPTPASPRRDPVAASPTAPITGAAASAADHSERSDDLVPADATDASDDAHSGGREPTDEPEPEPEPRGGSDSPTAGLSLYAGGLAFHGLAPELQPGLQLGLDLRVLRSDALDWVVRIAGRFAFEQEFRASAGLAQFSFLGGAVSLCAVGPIAGARFSVDGCLVGEPGVLSAAGTATRNAERYHRPWLALGGGAGVAWQAWRALGLRAGAELLAPIRRDSYRLGRELIHQVPAASVRLVLSLSVGLS